MRIPLRSASEPSVNGRPLRSASSMSGRRGSAIVRARISGPIAAKPLAGSVASATPIAWARVAASRRASSPIGTQTSPRQAPRGSSCQPVSRHSESTSSEEVIALLIAAL